MKRCKTCAHWDGNLDEATGWKECGEAFYGSLMAVETRWTTGDSSVWLSTSPKFGCVSWKERVVERKVSVFE
jgi:hypothetical protein